MVQNFLQEKLLVSPHNLENCAAADPSQIGNLTRIEFYASAEWNH
jgi:hypothetical protein